MKQHTQLMIPVKELKPLKRNARSHSKEQIDQIAASIERFGFLSPVVVDAERNVIAGNGRLMAAKKLKLKEVPAISAEGLSEQDLRAYALVDNRLGDTSTFHLPTLKEELEDLVGSLELDLSAVGFSPVEIEAFIGEPIGKAAEDFGGSASGGTKRTHLCPECGHEF